MHIQRSDDEPAVGHPLTYRLTQVEHLLEQRIDHALSDIGLTLRQVTVLTLIGQSPGVSRSQIARRLLTTPQAVGGLVQRLVDAGLVERAATGPGLPVGLTLTSAGQEALRRATPIARDAEHRAVAGVNERDRKQVEQVLDRLVTTLSR